MRSGAVRGAGLAAALLAVAGAGCADAAGPDAAGPDATVRLPPPGAPWDYQLGGDHEPAAGVRVLVRDWSSGAPLPGGYTLCYVNAFQTQPDEPGAERIDERSAWPSHLVLEELGEDPGWPGELLVDVSTPASRGEAARWLRPALEACADKGFDGVELDNLDSWTRLDGTDRAGRVPFGREDALAYAALLADAAHGLGLAVAQKNAPDLTAHEVHDVVGFDLVVAEQCGRYDECGAYVALHGRAVLDVEYDDEGFARACDEVGSEVSVVRRDVGLSLPTSPEHLARWC